MSESYIYKDNLASALAIAIKSQENSGNGKAALTEGFRIVLADIKNGKELVIRK